MLLVRQKVFAAWIAVGGISAFAWLAGDASAQVVQLPAVQTFGYSGSAVVPDAGRAYLGGVGRQRTAATARAGGGPMAGRGSSGAAGGTTISGWASIIDLQAMDAAILNQPAAKRPPNYLPRHAGAPVINTLTPHLYARRMGADESPRPNDPNAWEIALGGGAASQIGPANAVVHDDSAVRYFMLRAKEAQDAGRVAAAQVYYRMAYERLTPEQQERVQAIQAQADAAAQGGQPTAGTATPTAEASAAAPVAAAPSPPATSAASSEAATTPPAAEENANPFDSPF